MRKKTFAKTLTTNVDNKLISGTLITPLINFYLDLVLLCRLLFDLYKTHCVIYSTFSISLFLILGAGDENPSSGVVTKTRKLLGNSSCGYQKMDRSNHAMTNYVRDEKTH